MTIIDKKILINARYPEEKRVAIIEGKKLTDFYVEISSAAHIKGNIYKGVISGIERGLQAAFVDFGHEKHGFLPLRDVMPENYRAKPKDAPPDIKDVLAKGQELLVQVEHDQRGTKGASLTNRISLPGRYMVMMPGKERLCISRKIEDQEARNRMKDAFKGLRVPKNMGFILRTAGSGRRTEELADDLKYLTKLWNKINREAKKATPPALIYKEEDIAVRTVRDYLTEDVSEVIVDEPLVAKRVRDFLKQTMPGRSMNVTLYRGKTPLFDQHGLEEQIARLNDRQVELPSGGSIVIDKTEALTAIDVNSGRSKKDKGIEALALRTNIEAAEEIARQLRLRDIGGLIVIDFIDIEAKKNYKQIEDLLSKALDRDKAHYEITRISKFGILEMTRERMRSAYFDVSQQQCPACKGVGVIRSPELVALAALRDIHSRLSTTGAQEVICRLPVESTNHLLNQLRNNLKAVEDEFSIRLTILADPTVAPGEYVIETQGVETIQKPEQQPAQQAPKKKTRRGRRRSSKKPEQGVVEAETQASEKIAAQPASGEAAGAEQAAAQATTRKKRSKKFRRRPSKKRTTSTAQATESES